MPRTGDVVFQLPRSVKDAFMYYQIWTLFLLVARTSLGYCHRIITGKAVGARTLHRCFLLQCSIFHIPGTNASISIASYYFGASALEATNFGWFVVVREYKLASKVRAVVHFDLAVTNKPNDDLVAVTAHFEQFP